MRRRAKKIFFRATRTSQRGFTLLEVLIAMTLLSVGLLGTLGLTTGVIRGNFFSRNVSTATVIAETQLEEVHRRGYAGANTTNFPTGSQVVTMGGATFSRATTITNDSPQANMKKVAVKVTWIEGAAGNKEVLLETILAQ